MIKGIGLLALSLALTFSSGMAKANFVVYTNRASFEAALSSETTENFNELGPTVQFFPNGLSQPSITQPITVTGSGNYLLSGSASTLGGVYPTYGTFLVGAYSTTPSDGITVTFPANVTGAGADVTSYNANGSITFFGTTSQGENFTGTISTPGANPLAPLGFLGVATTSPNDFITSITFQASIGAGYNVVLDNASFGTAIPEPTSMALLVTGALVIGVGAIRRHSRSKTVI